MAPHLVPEEKNLLAQLIGLPRWLSGKESPCQAGNLVGSRGQEDPLEKEIIFAWEIPWTEEPGELQFMGS